MIVTTYLNFGHEPDFIEACAKDGRSFKPEVFEGAISVNMWCHCNDIWNAAAVSLVQSFQVDSGKAESFDKLVKSIVHQSLANDSQEVHPRV